MSTTYAGAAAAVMVLAAMTVGCSSKTATAPAASSKPAASSQASTTSAAPVTPTPVNLTIPVVIANGVVTTANNGEYDAKVGERIQFNIDSDREDQLHVHSVPEHLFAVRLGAQSFSFVVKAPGTVVAELHSTNKAVATITVR